MDEKQIAALVEAAVDAALVKAGVKKADDSKPPVDWHKLGQWAVNILAMVALAFLSRNGYIVSTETLPQINVRAQAAAAQATAAVEQSETNSKQLTAVHSEVRKAAAQPRGFLPERKDGE